MYKTSLILLFSVCTAFVSFAQSLPDHMYFSADGRILYTGGKPSKGLYNESSVKTIRLDFWQPNFWTQLTQNYAKKIDLPAKLTYEGVTYDSVGVRFKGQTSFSGTGASQKKSFNLTMDYFYPDQDLKGYNTLNLNNAFQDPSFLREIFYLHQIRRHIPAAKGNFVRLNINGQDWGLYANVQQLNGDFLEEWFLSNDGTNWRADVPPGSQGTPGWGDGTAALNYLGDDSLLYKKYYTLKSTKNPYPWKELASACKVLNTTPLADLPRVLPDYLDIDRTLWFLGSEILFSDDDSYVYKGKMDYYVYQDAETGRFTPIEYDGNSVMSSRNVTWSAFYNETKVNYPLLNRLLAVPELRQRYLAHLRTLIGESLDTVAAFSVIDNYVAMVDSIVRVDPKKPTTYAQFGTEVNALRNFIRQRRANLLANQEVSQPSPTVTETAYFSKGIQWENPEAGENATVRTKVSFVTGVNRVTLYYGTGVTGKFNNTAMYDDGAHDDGAANDGIYSGTIPGQPAGTWVRYYIEAVANNPAKSITYAPAGAEHDVFVYLVKSGKSNITNIVINEIMADNNSTAKDEAGEYDDWIELHNLANTPQDLGGLYLTDNPANLTKFKIPQGTVISAKGYLVLWADEDGSQGSLHCNFKLSATGEVLMLLDSTGLILDSLTFGQQQTDISWARIPNGTGPFVFRSPTFAANNEKATATGDLQQTDRVLTLVPNPARNEVRIVLEHPVQTEIRVYNSLGQAVFSGIWRDGATLNVAGWEPGLYVIQCAGKTARLLVVR